MRVAISLLLITCSTVLAASHYTEQMYREAVEEDGTSPLYLLFTFHDDKTGKDRIVCTSGPGLVGAIHLDHHLDFDEAGRKAARRIALLQRGHRFAFSSRKALHTVRPYYSEHLLTEVRQLLARRSNAQLTHALGPTNADYSLDWIYAKHGRNTREAYQEAVAHVLLERGILVGLEDRTGLLFVSR